VLKALQHPLRPPALRRENGIRLDADPRVKFINCIFRDYFSLPDAKAASNRPHRADVSQPRRRRLRNAGGPVNSFIARRMEMMGAGDSTSIIINLKEGTVLRFSCTLLPDGGRMLA
jgi:hypothetical protein